MKVQTVCRVKSSNLLKKRVKIMLDVITANEIVNALQCKGHNIEWVKDHYLKNFITMDSCVNVSICNVDYWVMPIIAFKNTNATVLGFVYERTVYEVGKYSRKTSRLFTNIYNAYFSDNNYDRVYMEKRFY
jgi:hypothetical protein